MGKDVPKGDVESLVLAVLATGACHGYAMAREVERRSADYFRLREGTLYPALRRLEARGWIEGAWEAGSGPPRRVYSLTEEGRREAARQAGEWNEYAAAMRAVMGAKGDANAQPA